MTFKLKMNVFERHDNFRLLTFIDMVDYARKVLFITYTSIIINQQVYLNKNILTLIMPSTNIGKRKDQNILSNLSR